jgi:hypothetical protein
VTQNHRRFAPEEKKKEESVTAWQAVLRQTFNAMRCIPRYGCVFSIIWSGAARPISAKLHVLPNAQIYDHGMP